MNKELYNAVEVNLSEFENQDHFFKYCETVKAENDPQTAWNFMQLVGSVKIWTKK